MSSLDTDILNDLTAALRTSGALASVELGGRRGESVVPRASVLLERRDSFPSESWPSSRWIRLQVRVLLRTRSESPAEGITRLTDLTATACDALLVDPYRGGRCCDLPVGRATEVQIVRHAKDERYPERATSLSVRSPEREICLVVRCHYELADAGTYPTAARLDGEDLFSSGPCMFGLGAWRRETIHRGFPGVVGELVFDLGLRGRPITQQGRLQSDTAQGLHDLLSAIADKNDAQLHTLTDHDGQTYTKVLVESFTPAGPVRLGRNYTCDYTVSYLQLP
ncbi:MAG: hypothetical protein JXA11_05770 [Phycisphaerae bacterium]|nr:hypothetical protein [Phycisphaerae bacterium]